MQNHKQFSTCPWFLGLRWDMMSDTNPRLFSSDLTLPSSNLPL